MHLQRLIKFNTLSDHNFFAVALILLNFLIISCVPFGNKRFDETDWKQRDSRYAMIDNIIDEDLLIGKSKEEVTNLLGDDFRKGSSYLYKKGNTDCITYRLYRPMEMTIDNDVLVIHFKYDTVVEVSANSI